MDIHAFIVELFISSAGLIQRSYLQPEFLYNDRM